MPPCLRCGPPSDFRNLNSGLACHTRTRHDPKDLKGNLKCVGGSQSDHWNYVLANQTFQTLWTKHSDDETRDQQFSATVRGLVGIGPRDELEGMIAAQLLAAHNAAMECYRRAMRGDQMQSDPER